MIRTLAPTLLLVALAAACGGGTDDATEVLSETRESFSDLRSGELAMRFVITPAGDVGGGTSGFELEGPFSLPSQEGLAAARLDYTQIAEDQTATVTLVSVPERAFVEVDGQAYELEGEQADQLRFAADAIGSEEGLLGFDLERWAVEPKLEDAGDGTERVTAQADPAAVLSDLIALGQLGPGPRFTVGEDDAARLRQALRSSSFELVTGKEDRLLRRLAVDLELTFDVPQELRDSLGRLAGARIAFEVDVGRANEAVSIAAPEDPLPYSELVGG